MEYNQSYEPWNLGDWEWALATWEVVAEVVHETDGLVYNEVQLIELVEERYTAGDLKGRKLVEQLRLDVVEAAKRLGCEEPLELKWAGWKKWT